MIQRDPAGRFEIAIPDEERDVLRSVLPQLQEMLAGDLDDPALLRLFPTAYSDDPERDREYQVLVRDELAQRHRTAVATMLETLDHAVLDAEQLTAWMAAVNHLRLVLGTRLAVTEDLDDLPDPRDPDAPLYALYGYLGYLLETMVEALSGTD